MSIGLPIIVRSLLAVDHPSTSQPLTLLMLRLLIRLMEPPGQPVLWRDGNVKPSGSSHITGSSRIEQTLDLLTVRPMDAMGLMLEDP